VPDDKKPKKYVLAWMTILRDNPTGNKSATVGGLFLLREKITRGEKIRAVAGVLITHS
jgi:hypothetical protein